MAQQCILPPASGSNVENLGQECNNGHRNNPLDFNGGVETAAVDPPAGASGSIPGASKVGKRSNFGLKKAAFHRRLLPAGLAEKLSSLKPVKATASKSANAEARSVEGDGNSIGIGLIEGEDMDPTEGDGIRPAENNDNGGDNGTDKGVEQVSGVSLMPESSRVGPRIPEIRIALEEFFTASLTFQPFEGARVIPDIFVTNYDDEGPTSLVIQRKT
jgi:hypothetical protein